MLSKTIEIFSIFSVISCKTRCNACGGYWIKEPQSVTLTQIANACSRHEQQFTEQQQNKHENNKKYILKHFHDMGCSEQHQTLTPHLFSDF